MQAAGEIHKRGEQAHKPPLHGSRGYRRSRQNPQKSRSLARVRATYSAATMENPGGDYKNTVNWQERFQQALGQPHQQGQQQGQAHYSWRVVRPATAAFGTGLASYGVPPGPHTAEWRGGWHEWPASAANVASIEPPQQTLIQQRRAVMQMRAQQWQQQQQESLQARLMPRAQATSSQSASSRTAAATPSAEQPLQPFPVRMQQPEPLRPFPARAQPRVGTPVPEEEEDFVTPTE